MASVYLAGPIRALNDGGFGWRDRIQRLYGLDGRFHDRFEFLNPLENLNAAATRVSIVSGETADENEILISDLVKGDKELIDAADAILVGYSDVQQIGTPMEVMYGYEQDLPVMIWIRDKTPVSELSPWYRYHANDCFELPTDALDAIQGAIV